MSKFQLAGIVLFLLGLVPYTIGGLIHLARHPRSWDSFTRGSFANLSWRPRAPVLKVSDLERSMYADPKSRWWLLTGAPVGLAGFMLLVFSTFELRFLVLFIGFAVVFFGVLSLVGDKR